MLQESDIVILFIILTYAVLLAIPYFLVVRPLRKQITLYRYQNGEKRWFCGMSALRNGHWRNVGAFASNPIQTLWHTWSALHDSKWENNEALKASEPGSIQHALVKQEPFLMDDTEHERSSSCWCRSKPCQQNDCSGRVHEQAVYGGIYWECDTCGWERY